MGSNGGNLIRLEEINRIQSKLEKDIDARKLYHQDTENFTILCKEFQSDQAQSMRLLLE